MANIAQPQVVINYISQLKKITVNRNNQPSQLIIQTDYNLNETYNFQVINKINQIVELDVNTTYQLYGTYIDSKKQVHVLFYTLGVTPRDNMLSFLVNTYTSEYLAYVKNNRTPIDISIVAKQNVGGSTKSYMVLRDSALANPRGYIEGQAPTDIVYQNVFNSQIPVSTAFGAGNNINLVQDLDEQQIYSFAFGDTLSTNNANQFVIGYNNEPDATKAFIVANSGNIFTVDYEGNVEAGDFNVGAISATSITVSGEDLNQVIDDKVEYLSTAVDDKLEATSGWVNETFEPISTAQQNFNTLTGQTSYLSGQIDDQTTAIGELNTAISSKANQTDLEELSGKFEAVEADYVTSGVLDAKTSAFITSSALDGYATESYVTGQIAPVQTEVDGLSGLVSAILEVEIVTPQEAEQMIADATSAMATTGWVSEQGYLTEVPNTYALKTDIPTSAETYEAISGDIEAQITGKNYITSDALNGLASDEDLQYVSGIVSAQAEDITALKAVSGEVDYETVFDMLSSGDTDTLTITKDTTNQKIVLTAAGGGGGGDKTYRGDGGIEVNNVTDTISISANFLSANALEGYATQSWVGQQGFALTSQLPTDYTTSAQVSSIVEGYDFATEAEIPTTVAELTDASDYALKSELPSDYTTSAQVSSIITGYNYITGIPVSYYDSSAEEQVQTNVFGLQFDSYTLDTFTSNDYLYIMGRGPHFHDSEDNNYEAIDVYFNSDFSISPGDGEVYISLANPIPSAISDLTNDSQFATSAQVSSIVEGYDYATESFVTGQGYITDADLTDYAQLSDIPTTVSELTNDSNYISAITLSAYNASTMQNEAVQTTIIDLASTDFVTWNGTVYINDNKFDIPTDAEISGIASAVASTYIEGSTISAVSQLINDVGFVTEPRVSAIASAYAQGGGGTTYTAGSGITIDNGTIKTNLVAGNNVTFSITDNAVTINATGGGGGGGSSDLSDYNNDVPFITAEDITNKQRVNTVNGSTITFDQAYEIFKTTYTGGDVTLNAVTVTTSQVGNGEVATFEEWITFSSAVTSLSEGTNTLVGEWPSSFDNTKTHVIVRRLVNNNGTITQYVSYAYNF